MALFGSKNNKTEEKKGTTKKTTTPEVKKEEKKSESESMKDLYTNSDSKVEGKKGKKVESVKFQEATKVLVRPLVTEKATNLAAESKYVFVVQADANKISVAKSIQAIYGVKPLAVNVVNMKGKQVARGRIKGKRKDWKKAIVTLKKGETIAIYEGV